MTITKLFESLDEKVFTPELKESLQTQFNEAVELQATMIADEKIEEAIDELDLKSRQYSDLLESKVEQYTEYVREETLEKVSQYLDVVVQEFVADASDALAESAKSEKADMMIEAFDSMLKATGTDFANIVESRDSRHDEEFVQGMNERVDSLLSEVHELRKQNDELVKLGLINELSEGLTVLEAAKFKRLADMVEFTRDEAYVDRLTTIHESVQGTSEAPERRGLVNNLNEEHTRKSDGPVWSHLV